MDNFGFFGLNLGKLHNYVQYFGSNNVEGVAESWVEAEMSWVEVDGAGWRWVHGLVIHILSNIRHIFRGQKKNEVLLQSETFLPMKTFAKSFALFQISIFQVWSLTFLFALFKINMRNPILISNILIHTNSTDSYFKRRHFTVTRRSSLGDRWIDYE